MTAERMADRIPLDALRARIRKLERSQPCAPGSALAFGIEAIDRQLPAGGLGLGLVHEVAAAAIVDAGAAMGFAAALLARRSKEFAGPVLWCAPEPDLYGAGLADAGLDPARLILVRTAGMAELLWTMEEALRCRVLAAVLGAAPASVDLTASRRLQLAAESGGGLGLVLDTSGKGFLAASALATRWQVSALPSGPTEEGIGIGAVRWRLELRRCRGGGTGEWNVEWCDETCDFALAASLVDRPRHAEPRRHRNQERAAGAGAAPIPFAHTGPLARAG